MRLGVGNRLTSELLQIQRDCGITEIGRGQEDENAHSCFGSIGRRCSSEKGDPMKALILKVTLLMSLATSAETQYPTLLVKPLKPSLQ